MMIRVFVISVLLLLAACSSKTINWNTNDYTVQSGDTLYSIAWRFEIDPDDLARWNNLGNSSLIHAGLRLHTTPSATKMRDTRSSRTRYTAPTVSSSPSKIKTVIVKQDETLYSIARKNKVKVRQLVQYNNIKKPYLIKPGQKLKLTAASKKTFSQQQKRNPSQRKVTTNQFINWSWPIKGKLIKTFNKRLNDAKGIDIAGEEGKGIKAAASGKVVYSGNGLISYGNLIIIKHNDLYLSAYAHNRKLLVKEGQQVKAGEIIAELGSTGADNPRLHFEIRKNGKPVDPVRYLPSS